ncbi:MAG: serine/threonine-protein kinase [Gordonia sp. (in: high G+C Gram-positive bacteria)]|uniref:serine/threonine-protein kinase n=1 Tax=Gordonia sp. (in: high G+C Gram-positive bacteria) TaxID=84139 RepID=UPI003BB6E6BD
MSENPGNTIAGYRLLREVGHGGMGKVYAAKHPRLPREDAIKILAPAYSNDPVFRARFEREGQLAASLEHANIVPVYDCGADAGRLWISMRLISGPTAATELKATGGGGLPMSQVIAICLPVARALDFAHSRNLQHRDVKPENILIDMSTGTPHPLLSDFGIARVVGDTSLSSTGMVIGTVDYSSPEHLTGEATDGRSDQYSLACTAAHLLTGVKPFAATSPTAVMMRHIRDERPTISTLRPGLPRAVDDVFRKALALNPAARYGSCVEFIAALDEASRTDTPAAAMAPHGRVPVTSRIAKPLYPDTQIADVSNSHATAPPQAAPSAPGTRSGLGPSGPHSGPSQPIPASGVRPPVGQPPIPPNAPPTIAAPHSSPPPAGRRQAQAPPPGKRRNIGLITAAAAAVVLVIAGGVTYAVTGGSGSDPDNASATGAGSGSTPGERESTAPAESSPPRQQYNILDAQRNALDPCKLPPNLLTAGGMNTGLQPVPHAEALLCEGTFTGNAPTVLLGGYVVGSPTADWMIDQYNRGTPAFDDLPEWRRYEATDRITRCKYGYVSNTSPRYTFEIAVQLRPAGGGFDERARQAACNRVAEVARAVDPAMPQ